MIPADCLIRQDDLAKLLGVSRSTITRWSKSELKAATFRPGKYKVQVLRELGILPPLPEGK